MKKVWHYNDTVPNVLNELQADGAYVRECYDRAKEQGTAWTIAMWIAVLANFGGILVPHFWYFIPTWTVYITALTMCWITLVQRSHYLQLQQTMSSTRTALMSSPPVRPDIIVEVDISLIPLRTRITKKLRSLTSRGRPADAESDR